MFLIPEVPKSQVKLRKKHKLIWTIIVLFIFLVCSQIPLYGIYKSDSSDPLHWMRVILASNKGTLMELGISPIITSGMIMQLLVGTRIIQCNMSSEIDRNYYEANNKALAVLIAFGEAVAYTMSGAYGNIDDIGLSKCMLLIGQLVFSSIIVIVLDEMLTKGYGLGSGISLFIATNICENIMWKSFSPFTVTSDSGVEYEGAFIALVHFLLTKQNKVNAIQKAFYRPNIPNLSNVVATLIVFFFVIYIQGFRKEIKIANKKMPGTYHTEKIKLFYCSNTPIILQSALVSNLYFISQILHKKYKDYLLVKLLGQWQETDKGYSIPIGGLSYYLSPPKDLVDITRDPLHSILYFLFVVLICGMFAKYWVEFSGKSSQDVARNLKENGFFLSGIRENEQMVVEQLERYIPVSSTLGGMCIGVLTIFADFLGAIGSGTGILLAVTIIYDFFDDMKEKSAQEKRSSN